MLTQIDHAKNDELTAEMQQVAVQENMDPDTVLSRVKEGSLVIMTRQGNSPVAIGKGATTKINVNLGSSAASIDPSSEIEKARIAEKYGGDTITDLSMGGDIPHIRKAITENTTLPLTTVPVYQAVVECGLKNVTSADILSYLRSQVDEGISSVVLHCVEKQMLEEVKGSGRLMGMVSKGGSFTSVFMLGSGCENPFLENFDEVMEILRDKDVVLSLGNTMRSGCIHDRPDKAQLMEMENNAALAKRANEQGVQVIIEGMGGHVAAASIPEYVGTYRSKSPHPLFVAGPLPTDIALGYDHVAGAIGASMASGAGADYLCYITPSEHLSLPTPDQVRQGLVAFKIAAHIGDSMKYGMAEKDCLLAKRRASFDWEGQMELAFDQDRPRDFCPMEGPCSMCGEYCAIQIMGEYLAEGE
ncbi:phosphomethylpyrimidine synthase ThiC [Methanohalophilus profundi]|uniref:phosphomethylpyrimidine synthase ThiC n=1 Tax=Methanohalophilus profundi TaxID=2138083 RepID=UPI00101D1618|nr:phosphomethylpyrimidine synthase ThiC [Methanohalophilus profundi]